MKFIRNLMDKQAPLFEKGGKLELFYPLFEAIESFHFTPGTVTEGAPHVRDAADLKRVMFTVVIALVPAILLGLWNIGYQINAGLAAGMTPEGWRGALIAASGLGFSPDNVPACFVHGLLYFLPVFITGFAVGGGIEVFVAIVRKHEVNEGFFVTGFLIPLILPPTIPLWQVAMATAFGVVIGKEIFGGTGMNIFNPALVSRAFLYFAYPIQNSGDRVWVALDPAQAVDGYSGATLLARVAEATPVADGQAWQTALSTMEVNGHGVSWLDAFIGWIPGSMGETSTLACLIGAAIMLITGVASWRIMVAMIGGALSMSVLMNLAGSQSNEMMNLPFHWHFVLGGFAFGMVFMATEPVTGTYTDVGRYIYGFGIGVMSMLIRVLNPAFPEGVMLAILFMNILAPLIDYVVVAQNIKRRAARSAI
ncbi:MAG: NADH:ubiquinone reductase (Na(+)-transporting) subunit B [Candidatus Hydrogenedens sp.]|jgi:Na+-transporting NADH:ubiquinone oxidoreductase subunit B|nr:NADH:ubiquinone reductase (Na(+)-transporting) subunit B [Candidatus Hydrogenedens sp.]